MGKQEEQAHHETGPVDLGHRFTYMITSTGKLIDDALGAVEKENPELKGVLNKTYTQLQLDPSKLSSLIDLIPFSEMEGTAPSVLGPGNRQRGSLQARDILGQARHL